MLKYSVTLVTGENETSEEITMRIVAGNQMLLWFLT
jgi:hypothetical protein